MFSTRLVTAALALAVFLAGLFWLPPVGWLVCLLPLLLLAAREWGALAGFSSGAAWAYSALTCGVGVAVAWSAGPDAATSRAHEAIYLVAAAFWLVVAPLWLARHWRLRGLALAAVGWIVLVPMWLALVQLQAAPAALLGFMAVIWVADTLAYLAGRRWGRHKLAPAISPGKTWEGVGGAAVGVALYYALLQALVPAPSVLHGGIAGLAFAALLVLSIEGDLFESLMKRQAGVKDSGRVLPGHGGVLDRIDGLTATLPAVALLLRYVG